MCVLDVVAVPTSSHPLAHVRLLNTMPQHRWQSSPSTPAQLTHSHVLDKHKTNNHRHGLQQPAETFCATVSLMLAWPGSRRACQVARLAQRSRWMRHQLPAPCCQVVHVQRAAL